MCYNDNLDQNVLDSKSKVLNLLVSTQVSMQTQTEEPRRNQGQLLQSKVQLTVRQHWKNWSLTSVKANQSLLLSYSKSARRRVQGSHLNIFLSTSGWSISITTMTSTGRATVAYRTRTCVSPTYSGFVGRSNVNHSWCMNPSAQPDYYHDTGWHSFRLNLLLTWKLVTA